VLLVVSLALLITIPALFGNSAGLPVAFFAVTSITTIGLYIAYSCPSSSAGGWGTASSRVCGPLVSTIDG
jgi:hypothetical protein